MFNEREENMFFLVDNERKILFGWSAKCGCSHIKSIFWYFQTGLIKNKIHTHKDRMKLPDDIENFTTIIIVRNPFHRLVSGFLNKYSLSGEYRCKWKTRTITFADFVEDLVREKWDTVDRHHFDKQTTENFDCKKILQSKIIKCYDLPSIDYGFIESLFRCKIPEEVLNRKFGHERANNTKPNWPNEYVYDVEMNEYFHYNVDYKYFYSPAIKEKLIEFYKDDFDFFNQFGITYDI